jgi:hypothetical protein
MSKKSQSTYAQKLIPVEIWAMFVWSLQQMLYVVLMHLNTAFSSSSHRGPHSVEIPGFTRISLWEFSTPCCSTSEVIDWRWLHQSLVSPQPKIQRIEVKGSCRPGDWASASCSLFTESLVQVLSDNAEKMRWCPIMHEPHVLSLMERHMFQEYW